MALEQELETYKAHLPELKQQEGKFVLIHQGDVIDTFSSYDDAIKQGYKQFGLEPFLVKQIHAIEPTFYVTRPIRAARHTAG
jgi:competence protein ComGF